MSLQVITSLGPDDNSEAVVIPPYRPGEQLPPPDDERGDLPVAEVTGEVSPSELAAVEADADGARMINGKVGDVCHICLAWSEDVTEGVCTGCDQELAELGFVRYPEEDLMRMGREKAPEWLPINEAFDINLAVAKRALLMLDRFRALVIGVYIGAERPEIRLAREAPAQIPGLRRDKPPIDRDDPWICSVNFAGCLLEWRRP